ncbi:hypothetical protein [Paludisphaera mucosa]|uniref:Uncharacterized protein n=1 Tax=Paludisphaera mucosa TaxID=3030827 RepID=A0ABT6F4K5_9BACT|nr:hypothetical protein [Paludisphaera mucosa]MDG3002506.1 hypothetical protein [Paludisphaera mucosa]
MAGRSGKPSPLACFTPSAAGAGASATGVGAGAGASAATAAGAVGGVAPSSGPFAAGAAGSTAGAAPASFAGRGAAAPGPGSWTVGDLPGFTESTPQSTSTDRPEAIDARGYARANPAPRAAVAEAVRRPDEAIGPIPPRIFANPPGVDAPSPSASLASSSDSASGSEEA